MEDYKLKQGILFPAILAVIVAATPISAGDAPDRPQATHLYWGDTHVHTSNSFDVFLFGTPGATPATAYRFARGLPVVNPTGNKRRDFWSYYTPEIREHARKVFGPYMAKWGYTFPPEWGDHPPDIFSRLQFVLLGIVRRIRWRYMT